ncbi:cache domain-containing protein [Noviherbaspirillum sp. ST9]|uniref:cache domain-containing protein n=1 Tax=Noviherbaspirillum sp. ST9 TaxID=3401606 RepID=UPI003B5883DE
MTTLIKAAVTAALAIAFGSAAAADNKQECVSMVKKAGDFLAANGKDKTLAEINNPKGLFSHGEIYLFASDHVPNWDSSKDRTITLAHGANPKLVGKDMTDLKDADGFAFVKRMAEIASSKSGEGWTDYKWPNPVTKAIEPKTTFTKRIEPLVISCGVYK